MAVFPNTYYFYSQASFNVEHHRIFVHLAFAYLFSNTNVKQFMREVYVTLSFECAKKLLSWHNIYFKIALIKGQMYLLDGSFPSTLIQVAIMAPYLLNV